MPRATSPRQHAVGGVFGEVAEDLESSSHGEQLLAVEGASMVAVMLRSILLDPADDFCFLRESNWLVRTYALPPLSAGNRHD
jgi:hypothetical protein